MSDLDTILKQADAAFIAFDKAQRAVIAADAKLRELRSRYGIATGTYGVRLEGLRHAVDVRFGRRAA